MHEAVLIGGEHIRAVFQRYVDLVTEGDAAAIALLYAEDATVEDPVGSPPHRGRAAILEFYRGAAGAVRLVLEGRVRVAGCEGAAAMVAHLTAQPGTYIETLDVMRFDAAGLIVSMRAFWGPDSIHRE